MFVIYAPRNINELIKGKNTRNQETSIYPLLHIQFSKVDQRNINNMENSK
jgi:hypothetical protein